MKHKDILFAIILMMIFSFSVFGQSMEDKIKTFKNSDKFSARYDKFKDSTLVVANLRIKHKRDWIEVGVSFMFSGEKLTADPPAFMLVLTSKSYGWRFLEGSRKLIFLVDDKRLEPGEVRRTGTVGRTSFGNVTELLMYSVTKEDLRQIADGKSVEFQVGGYDYTLPEEHKQLIKDFLSLIEKPDNSKK